MAGIYILLSFSVSFYLLSIVIPATETKAPIKNIVVHYRCCYRLGLIAWLWQMIVTHYLGAPLHICNIYIHLHTHIYIYTYTHFCIYYMWYLIFAESYSLYLHGKEKSLWICRMSPKNAFAGLHVFPMISTYFCTIHCLLYIVVYTNYWDINVPWKVIPSILWISCRFQIKYVWYIIE